MAHPKFNFKDIATPKSGLQVYTNSYWLCKNGDTTKALFFGDSPQCNANLKICEWTPKHNMYKDFNLQIVFVPVAYVPIRN